MAVKLRIKHRTFKGKSSEELQDAVDGWLKHEIDNCDIKSQEMIRDGENLVLSVFYTGHEHRDDMEFN